MTAFTTATSFDDGIDVHGTHLQGHVSCSYGDIVKCFGEPIDLTGMTIDGKSDVEWVIEFEDGTVATIYNWKNGPAYCGQYGTPVKSIRHWNIGGKSYKARDLVVTELTVSMLKDS